jgi:hypothetical protein
LKPVPGYPDHLRVEFENSPDLVVVRDWVETIKLADKMTASGEGISSLRTFSHHPIRFKHSTLFVDIGCYSGKMEKEMNVFTLGQLSKRLTRIGKRLVDLLFEFHFR